MLKSTVMSEFEKRIKEIENKFFKVLSSKKPLSKFRSRKSKAMEKYGLTSEQFATDLNKKAEIAKSSMDRFLRIVNR